jgi:hypothetical protein
LHGPVGPALTLEALVVHVLVEVELAEDAVPGERRLRRRDLIEVAAVVGAGAGGV